MTAATAAPGTCALLAFNASNQLAVRRGGPDNATGILVFVDELS